MLANDYILEVKDDLQEKSEHWGIESLFLKLQRAYISLQFDLPFFISKEEILIQEGKSEFYIEHHFLKNIDLKIDDTTYKYLDMEQLIVDDSDNSFYGYATNRKIILNTPLIKDATAKIAYRFERKLDNANCYLELPNEYYEALRCNFLSKIYEKPVRNTKERDLSKHYLNLYNIELGKLKVQKKALPKFTKSKYQII
jgi:hypothetical protein